MLNEIYEKLTEKYLEKIKFNENLSKYHTFRINGTADVIVEPTTKEELVDIVNICKENEYRFNVIGNGSNIIFKRGAYKGVLIVTRKIKNITIEGNKITCDCGVPLPVVAMQAMRNNLAGIEKLSGVPGTIGGAVLMNAGSYGVEMKDVLSSITVLDKDMNVLELKPEDLEMTYRHTNVKEKGYIVLGCEFTLTEGKQEDIKLIIDECKAKRLSSQPYEYPNAGSIFKKEGEYFAGKLIDDCGLKGFSVGGAMVSTKHANFIVNKENASYEDVAGLITYIQQAIYAQTKVELKTEVEII